MLRRIFLPVFLLIFAHALHATHNRAGEITYQQIGDLTIRAIITTYTKTSSVPADRDTLELFWGDGTSTMVPRSNGNGMPLPNDIKVNFYIAEHTYPGRATYTLSMMDPNRIGGILNVNPPNSDGVPFYLETTFTFLNTQFQGLNNSPVLLQPPLEFTCVGQRYVHNPNAFDVDLDSLSYELIVPLQDSGMVVPNYIFPDQISPGPANQISLNPVTGDFVWVTPQVAGTYNIAFRIHEYRNGQRINSMIRDMQILVLSCENRPPLVESIDEYCVVAGETVEIDISVSDPDSGQQVALSVLGGPLEISDQVSLSVGSEYMDQPFEATFRWTTTCNEVADQYYTVVFKGVDDFFGVNDTTGLADLKTVRIKVVAPAPEDVRAESIDDALRVSWARPYACEVTDDEYFRGFSVWRRVGSNPFVADTCTPGLEGQGYTQIGFNILENDGERYFFNDAEVERGKTYCYRVLGEFALLSPSGNPFNRVESLPSDEFCVQLSRDIPLLTMVSVDETDPADGQMSIKWVKPLPEQLDTVEHPGPYRFRLLQSAGIGTSDFSPVPNGDFSSPTFQGLKDTMVVQNALDTENSGHTYRIDFTTNGGSVIFDDSPVATSVYLSTVPTDQSVILSWNFDTPWENFAYEVFRSQDQEPFELVATVAEAEYRDMGLVNGEEYCYFIRSLGSYGIGSLPDPLINDSQVACQVPFDDVAPCAPEVDVTNLCGEAADDTPEDAFRNTVVWNPDPACNDNDIATFEILYTPFAGGELSVIETVDASEPDVYVHQPADGIAGCYAVQAVDENGNRSELSNITCVENCPFYSLPNVFTPNGDGNNDLFVPFPYRFVDRVEFKVFNKWGQLVFQTTDPELNWDGSNLNGGELSDGVYHYVCRVFEQGSAQGNVNVQILKGYIELIRGSR